MVVREGRTPILVMMSLLILCHEINNKQLVKVDGLQNIHI